MSVGEGADEGPGVGRASLLLTSEIWSRVSSSSSTKSSTLVATASAQLTVVAVVVAVVLLLYGERLGQRKSGGRGGDSEEGERGMPAAREEEAKLRKKPRKVAEGARTYGLDSLRNLR